jgi:hypothetical protein
MRRGDFFVQRDRFPEQLDAAPGTPCLQGDHSQHMQRIEMLRLSLQNIQINALRGRKIALPMQRQPLPEPGLQCRPSC